MRRALEPSDYPYFDYRRLTFSLGIVAEGQVWLSGSTAARFENKRKTMVVEGDLIAQAELIYDKMSRTLSAENLTLENITRVVQYVTPAAVADIPRLEQLRRAMFQNAAPIVSIVFVDRLLREAALIEIEATASNGGAKPAVISSVVEGDAVDGDIAGQCRGAYTRLKEILERNGASLASVVKTTEFITPAALSGYRHTADIRREVFETPYPAATGVILDRVAKPGSQILVEATALRTV